MRAVRARSRPVRDVEVVRLAREALTLQVRMPGPVADDAVDTAMALYAKSFGYGEAMAYMYVVRRELSEQAWNAN